MHQQIRFVPAQSPPDIDPVIEILEDSGIEVLIVGGSNIEHGGEVAIGVEDEYEDKAFDLLAAYRPRRVDVATYWIPANEPLAVLRVIREQARNNQKIAIDSSGVMAIRDVAVGMKQNTERQIPVQIYSNRRPRTEDEVLADDGAIYDDDDIPSDDDPTAA
jgi:hypothetical protein